MAQAKMLVLAIFLYKVQAHPIEQRCEFQSTRKFVYSVGAKWEIRVGSHKDAQCMRCTCLPGAAVSCVPSEKVCPRIDECLQYEDVPNSCCPKCIEIRNEAETADKLEVSPSTLAERRSVAECFHNGILYADGERWSPESNTTAIRPLQESQCVQCDCQNGQTICYLKSCPALSCRAELAVTPHNCCPVCTDALPPLSKSMERPAGSKDSQSSSDNATPILSDSSITSVYEEEPETHSDGTEEETQGCESGPETYEDGAQWHPTIPPFGTMKCVLCECDNGDIKCKRMACPEDPPCRNPMFKPGQCCAVCPTESNEIANVSAFGPYLCLRSKDYLVYEHLHGGTVEIVLRLPEQEMLWILTWTVNSNEETAISSSELKLWEFRTQNWSTENFKLLGTARPRRVARFLRRINKIRFTCRQRCGRRMERLVQVLRIQAAHAGTKASCSENSRPVDTRLSSS